MGGTGTTGRTALAVVAVVLGSLAAPLETGTSAPALAAEVATVTVTAPAQARAGDRVTVHVEATGLTGAAGYQVDLGLPPGALELEGARALSARLSEAGGALVAVPPVPRPGGASVAAWSCTSPACLSGALPAVSPGPGLVDVELVARRSGPLGLSLQRVVLVDAGGRSLPVRVRQVSGAVPEDPARLPRPGRASPGDLTGDGQVDEQDLTDLALAQRDAGAPDVVALQELAAVSSSSGTRAGPSASAEAAPPAYAFTVTSTGDEDDIGSDGACRTSLGTCTLRAAITESKRQTTHPVTIGFDLPGSGPFVIAPATRLPTLSNPRGVTIDGYTQPGAAPNTDPLVSNARIAVELVGRGTTGIDGLLITSTDNVVRGLSIREFRHNVWLYGPTAGNNRVVGSFIGTDPSGTRGAAYDQVGSSGVNIQGGAYGNTVGGPDPADRNVLSGNYQHGVATYDGGTTGNVIQGNLIGLDPSGTARLANRNHGVDINTFTTDTVIGGTGPGEGNVTSGNLGEGVEISHGTGTLRNDVLGNLIGTTPGGTAAPAFASNRQWGVRLEGAATCAPCPDDAGRSTVAHNVIVNNLLGGVLTDKGFHDSVIRDNRIGLLADGTPAKNTLWGIRVAHGASRFTLGPGNVVAHNDQGIQVDGTGVSPDDPQSLPTQDVRITRNSVFGNGDGVGVDLAPLGTVNRAGNADADINRGVLAPVLTSITAGAAVGTTCPGCVVELFEADRPAGQVGSGKRWVSTTVADASGAFVAGLDTGVQGRAVTTSATESHGSTSEFSLNVAVPQPRPGNVAPTASGSVTCSHLTCDFDAAASSDPDGSVVNWLWDFGDGATDNGRAPTHTYERRGTYPVQLTVVDGDGGTATTTLTALPVNTSPTAAFTPSCVYLTCSFDAAASTDPDGTVASYAWDFGDGSTGQGLAPSHAFAAAGTAVVTLTATDDDGDTGTTSRSFAVTLPPPGASATDAFGRTSGSGWRNAELGGTYTYLSGSNGLSVDGSTGLMSLAAAGNTRSAYLNGLRDRDVDLRVVVGTNKAPTGFGQSTYLVSRNVATNTSYRSRLRFGSNNGVYLTAMRVLGAAEQAIGPEVQVPGLVFAPGTRYVLRTSVTGASPTTLALKAWPVGATEPDWQLTRTDSEPVLQAAGSAAVMSYLSPSTTNAPVVFRYDDLLFGATDVAPTAAGTLSCNNKTCAYDAGGSRDVEGPVVGYLWDFGDGTTSTSATGTHRYADLTDRDVVLTVTDAKGATGQWFTRTALSNAAPTAAMTLTCTDLSCSATADGSQDPDGDLVAYDWAWGDGATSTGPAVSHAYEAGGEVAVILTVTDDDGATAVATQTVFLVAPNVAPSAVASVTCVERSCTADATGSSDDGAIVALSWDWGDGSPVDVDAIAAHDYAAAGTYAVTLTVTDERGGTGTATTTVQARDPNQGPSAAFGVVCTALSCAFDAGSSADPDGGIASYAWDFGDGTAGTGVTTTRAYAVGGSYPVRLVVTDDLGATATAVGTARPVPPANPSPAFASDAFGRTTSNGWGTADLGGAWTPSSSAGQFSVSGGGARLALTAAGTGRAGWLLARTSSDTDATVSVSFDKAATGSGDYASLIGRRVALNTEYRARLRVSGNRAYLTPVVLSGSTTETPLAPELQLPGVTYAVGTTMSLRMQVVGTAPTTLRLKAWPAASPEPAGWAFALTDGAAALQAPGAVGLHAQLSSSVTNAPVTTSFSGYAVRRSDTPPTGALTVSCTGLECTADATASTDAQGPLTYAVSFGDGATSTLPSATHAYAAPGTYAVSLTVTDSAGLTSFVEQVVTAQG